MTTVLLLRHGEITQSSPRRFVGQSDLPLTDRGRRQAVSWSEPLSGLPLVGAWCSSLSRCRETAELALSKQPIQALPLDGLREISLGKWEGLSEAEVRQRYPGEFERRGSDLANVAPAGGESFAQAQRRAWIALSGILAQTAGLNNALALVVAHAGINRALICQALGLPLSNIFSIGQDYAGLSALEFSTPTPLLRALNFPPMPAAELATLLSHTKVPC
ncbi:histidine phosphatase family protein [Humidesulfovibrio sp.]|jgi:probable phosphoglycerate mutase|uniref:histidine phosphatase family protein n=1 Tax=Humidesulfovibrio sp. TaxID=2910988 RepID=UPI0027359959|nr:histidine phosphatase family protein [Humidesulfovibrio sp.]